MKEATKPRKLYEVPCIDWDDDGNEVTWTSIMDEDMNEVTEFNVGDRLRLDQMPFDRYEDGKGFIHHTGWCYWDDSQWQNIWEDDDED